MRFSTIILLLFLFSCQGDNKAPNISNIELDWEFVPFHELQQQLKDPESDLLLIHQKHPAFTNLFFSSVLPLPPNDTEERNKILLDSSFITLVDTCSLIFEDWKDLKSQFDHAFRYYNAYTEDVAVPNVYTFVSGFAYQNFVFQDGLKDGLGIGLDMYMGNNFPYKSIDPRNPTFSQFLTQYFDKKYLVRKSLLAWLDDKVPSAQSSQLLEIIIRNGKINYILEHILPDEGKDVVIEFQPEEYEWCLFNEPELWTHLLKNDLLYSSDFSKINKLINPSPNVPGIPVEAPGGVANYLGWRIVQDYMARSKSSMADLITEMDFQKIFQESKYRPRVRKW